MRINNPSFRSFLIFAAACSMQACGSPGSDEQSRTAAPGTAQDPASSGLSAAAEEGAATELSAEIVCDPTVRRKGLAQLSWTPADPPGEEQRVVVTIFKEGFESGAFEESKALPADQETFLLESVHGQAIHRWRVLTVTATSENPSETALFEGPVCIGDVVVDEPIPVE